MQGDGKQMLEGQARAGSGGADPGRQLRAPGAPGGSQSPPGRRDPNPKQTGRDGGSFQGPAEIK